MKRKIALLLVWILAMSAVCAQAETAVESACGEWVLDYYAENGGSAAGDGQRHTGGLVLNADGTAVLTVNGQDMSAAWWPLDNDLVFNDGINSYWMYLDGDTLSIAIGAQSMVFRRKAESVAAQPEETSSGVSAFGSGLVSAFQGLIGNDGSGASDSGVQEEAPRASMDKGGKYGPGAPAASAESGGAYSFRDAAIESAARAVLGKSSGEVTREELGSITELTIEDVPVGTLEDLRYFVNLERLDLSGCGVSDLSPLAGLTKLEYLWMFNNEISDLTPLAGLTNLRTLSLSANRIGNVAPLAGLTNLTFLVIWYNEITDVSPLAGLTNLTHLDLDNNSITDVAPLAGLVNLTSLCLNGNPVADLSPVRNLPRLEILEADEETPAGSGSIGSAGSGTVIGEYVFADPVIEAAIRSVLEIESGPVTYADLEGVTSLVIDGESIRTLIDLHYCPNLTSLELSSCGLTDLSELSVMTQLRTLWLFDNRIRDISPLARLTNLDTLSLSANEITDISPLAGLTKLTFLPLWYNEISDISPLAGLTNLTFLDLEGNRITDVSPLKGLVNLEDLCLLDNPLTDVSVLAGLPNLQYLYVDDGVRTGASGSSGSSGASGSSGSGNTGNISN